MLNFIPSSNREKAPVWPTDDSATRSEPSLDSLVPDDAAKPYDIKELIVKIADEYDFFEIQPDYAQNIVVGFIRIEGQSVGVIAN